MDQHGIFAREAQPGLVGVAAFQDRAGIDVDTWLIGLTAFILSQVASFSRRGVISS